MERVELPEDDEEIAKVKPENIRKVTRVMRACSEEEADSDHLASVMDTYNKLIYDYGEAVWPESSDVSKEDVAYTVDFLARVMWTKEEVDSYHESFNQWPDAIEYEYFNEFVITNAGYTNGYLPRPENVEALD